MSTTIIYCEKAKGLRYNASSGLMRSYSSPVIINIKNFNRIEVLLFSLLVLRKKRME